MMNTKISIIVPIYNAEQFLPKCIESIQNQTYKNLEIILVNDGSTDNSLNICYNYAKKDNRIIVIDKDNGGVSSARNAGLDIATGAYIGFVDSDDYISNDMYEKLYKTMEENNADIVECGYYVTDKNYNILNKYKLKIEIISGEKNCSFHYVTKKNTTNFNVNKLFKRYIFRDIRYSNFKYSEDYVVNSKAFSKCRKKITIEDCCYYYVKHNDSACNQGFNQGKLDILKAGKEVYAYYKDKQPELCKFIIIYIINNIRKLYVQLMDSNIINKNEFKSILLSEYKYYYTLIKKDLYRSVKYKKTFLALWIFSKNPNIYYIVEKIKSKI